MSTYEVKTRAEKAGNAEVLVTMGWDPVLKRFFLVVQDPEGEDDLPLYSNLDDKGLEKDPSKYRDVEYFKAKAKDLGLNIPELYWIEMAEDQEVG